MKPSRKSHFLTLLAILCMGLALSASKLRLPAFRQSAAPAQAQAAPAPGGNDVADEPARPERTVSLQTDKMNYAAGEVIIVTGSGWDPGEAVTLRLHEEPTIHADRSVIRADRSVTVIADTSGSIFDNQFAQRAQ